MSRAPLRCGNGQVPNHRKVMSLSLGGGYSAILNEAVRSAVDFSGITTVVAAGNAFVSACAGSPGGVASGMQSCVP